MNRINLSEEQAARLKKLGDEAYAAIERYKAEVRKIKKELVDAKYPILGFLSSKVWNDAVKGYVDWTRLAFLTSHQLFEDSAELIGAFRSKMSQPHLSARYHSVSSNGRPGNNIYGTYREEEMEFVPFGGTVDEARKILSEIKKEEKNAISKMIADGKQAGSDDRKADGDNTAVPRVV